jgi:hypothetical protein
MAKYFNAGIPATGKTPIGDYFESNLFYENIDLEAGRYHLCRKQSKHVLP